MPELYVTVDEGQPCQVVGCHPLSWTQRKDPSVYLVHVQQEEWPYLLRAICGMSFTPEQLQAMGQALLTVGSQRRVGVEQTT